MAVRIEVGIEVDSKGFHVIRKWDDRACNAEAKSKFAAYACYQKYLLQTYHPEVHSLIVSYEANIVIGETVLKGVDTAKLSSVSSAYCCMVMLKLEAILPNCIVWMKKYGPHYRALTIVGFSLFELLEPK